MLKLKKIFAAFVGVATLANMAIPFSAFAEETTSYTYAYDNYKVDYSITNSWGSNQDVSVTITNTGIEVIENWMLAYDFNGQIESIWRADVASKNDMEYVRNAGYNANIAPNQSVNFGYSLLDVEGVPDTFVMCQKRLPKDTGYDVELNVNQSWGDSFNGEIVLTNTTDEPIECWELTFDTNFTITEITNSWAADVTELEPYSYMLKGTYTGTVDPNSSVVLGFTGVKNGDPKISNMYLTEVVADSVDYSIHLKADTKKVSTAVEHPIAYFYADTRLDVDHLTLIDASTNEAVATMVDDGKYSQSGDDLMNDGVYSCKLELDNSQSGTLSYYAVSEESKVNSNSVKIKVYVALTSQNLKEISAVDEKLLNLQSSDEFTNMSLEERCSVVEELLLQLAEVGTDEFPYSLVDKTTISYNGNNLYAFHYACGSIGTVTVKELDSELELNEANVETRDAAASENIDVHTFTEELNSDSTILDTTGFLGDAYFMYAFDNTIGSDRYPNYVDMQSSWTKSGLNTVLDTEITVDSFRNLTDYEIVVFAMHGMTLDEDTPLLCTLEKATDEKDENYIEDLASETITKVYSRAERAYYYAIMPSFFTDYYDNESLNNTIVFMENCEGFGANNVETYSLSKALLDSGVNTIVGFHNSVYAIYSRDLMRTFIEGLMDGKTVQAALDTGKAIYGDNSTEWLFKYTSWSYDPYPTSYPIIDGNKTKRLFNDGISNGGFEESANTAVKWSTDGDVRAIKYLGSLRPFVDDRMALISTGIGSKEVDYLNATEGSVMTQTFRVPENATTLTFNYNVVSEEPLEWLGSNYDDTFKAFLYSADGSIIHEETYMSIHDSKEEDWIKVDDIDFEGGDDTTYITGWKSAVMDISGYSGQFITLRYCVYDAGDSIYDTAVLIDNVKVA